MVRIAKHLSAVDKSAFTDILLHGYIHNCSLQHMVVYSGLCIRNSLTVFTWKILFGMHNAHIRQLAFFPGVQSSPSLSPFLPGLPAREAIGGATDEDICTR